MIDETAERQRIVRCLNCHTSDVAVHAPAGFVQKCGCCGRTMTVCDADPHGCGSVPAQEAPVEAEQPPKEEKIETWRDRPAML